MRRPALAAALTVILFVPAISAIELMWIGAADNRWANASNWSPPQVPQSADDLVFVSGPVVLVNDLAADVVLRSVKVHYPATITGSVLQVTNEIYWNSRAGSLASDVRAMGNLNIYQARISGSFNVNGFTVAPGETTFDGPILGTGTLTFWSDWNHINGEAQAFTGLVQIAESAWLTVDGSVSAPIVGLPGTPGHLLGAGKVGIVTGNLTVYPQYELRCGNIDLNAGLETTISGVEPGTWGKLIVNGTVTLRSPRLGVAMPNGLSPPVGQVYVMIDNDGSDPVSGTFGLLSEGSVVYLGQDRIPFRISYRGGDGNDVTLTRMPQPVLTITQSSTTTVYGEPFTITATAVGGFGTATGSVTFSFNHMTRPLVNGQAVYTLNDFPASSELPFNATYSGDVTYGAIKSNTITHRVETANTALALDASEIDTVVRLTATVSPRPPSERLIESGSIGFYLDSVSLGALPVQAGTVSIDVTASPGAHAMSAIFLPSTGYHSSNASGTFTVRAATAITATASSSVEGAAASVLVTVAPSGSNGGVPTGSVTLLDGTIVKGSGTLSDGKATIMTVPLAAGGYTFTAAYSGDAQFRPSSTTVHVSVAVIVISAQDATFPEGDSGSTLHNIELRLSEPPAQVVTVDYTTLDISAVSGRDYDAARGTVTFARGQTLRSVPISIKGNDVPEADKQLSLQLDSAIGGSLRSPRVTITIANDDVPGTATRDLVFATAAGAQLRLDLFMPDRLQAPTSSSWGDEAPTTSPLPLIVGIDAPDWQSPRQHSSIILNMVSRGYAVALVTFRSPAAAIMPAQIADVRAAVRWLRKNAAELHLDPDRFGSWGIGTAGGHLAALLATADGITSLDDPSLGNNEISTRVQAVVDWYGATDLVAFAGDLLLCDPLAAGRLTYLLGCHPSTCLETARNASAITWASAGDAAILSMHGTNDCSLSTSQSSELVNALKQVGVDAMFVPVPNAGHEYYDWNWQSLVLDVEAFFDRTVKAYSNRRRAVQH